MLLLMLLLMLLTLTQQLNRPTIASPSSESVTAAAVAATDAADAVVGPASVTLLNESHFIYMWHFCGSDYDTCSLWFSL